MHTCMVSVKWMDLIVFLIGMISVIVCINFYWYFEINIEFVFFLLATDCLY